MCSSEVAFCIISEHERENSSIQTCCESDSVRCQDPIWRVRVVTVQAKVVTEVPVLEPLKRHVEEMEIREECCFSEGNGRCDMQMFFMFFFFCAGSVRRGLWT